MDLKHLAVVVCQRLAPVYVALGLSWVTSYVVFTIGGIGLALALELAWPLLRPFCAVLYEELMAQHSQAQAQRRTALLKTFLPFFPGLQNSTHNLSTRLAGGVCARSRRADCHVR